eukprot:19371-Alexandrium_andersonii.AAC.1
MGATCGRRRPEAAAGAIGTEPARAVQELRGAASAEDPSDAPGGVAVAPEQTIRFAAAGSVGVAAATRKAAFSIH